MDYKEKYEMALEGIQEILGSGEDSIKMSRLQLRLQGIFPELKESEDERTRKALINFLHEGNPFKNIKKETRQRWIAWLEKQGEQKPADKVEPKFRVGDTIKCKYDYRQFTIKSVDLDKGTYTYTQEGCGNDIDYADEEFELVEKKPADKVEPKFKVGDVIKPKDGGHEPWKIMQVDILDKKYRFKDDYVIHFSQEDAYELVEQKPAEWNTNDEQMLNSTIKDLIHPCYEEIPDRIEEEIKWIKSMRNRVVSQPKQEWSEEDEANLDYFIDFCNGYYNGNKPVLTESTARSLSNWLYRLKSCEIMSKTNKIDNKEAEKTIHLACEFIRHRMESNGNIGGVDYAELIKRLKSLKDRVQLQPKQEWKQENTGVPKQEWSEEDETYLDHIITAIKSYYTDDKGKENPWREELLRWLKSLKERYTWKPSDEQINNK